MRSRCLLASSLAALLLFACARADQPPADPEAQPREGGTIRLAIPADPGTLNPVRYRGAHAAQIYAILQPGLMTLDQSGHWGPGLARAWEWEDETTLLIELDTALRWSDGVTFTAEDVVSTWDLYADPAVGYREAARIHALEGYRAIGDDRLRVTFDERGPDPLLTLQHDVLPAHVIADLDRGDPPSWSLSRAPVTLGAYRLAEWRSGERLLLARNPHHPRPANIESVEIRILPDGATRLLQLQTGEVDVVGAISVGQVERLEEDERIRVVELPGRSVAFLHFNLRDPVLSDARVREAFDHAFDRQAICAGPLFGYAKPAGSLMAPVSWVHAVTSPPTEFRPDRARRLLDAAGFEDTDADGIRERDGEDHRLVMLYATGDPAREAVAVLVQAQLRDVGVEVELRPLELGAWIEAGAKGEFQLTLAQGSGPLGADLRPYLGSGGQMNFTGWASSTFDSICARYAATSDREEATRTARQIHRMVREERPICLLYHPDTVVALRTRVRAATPTWLSPFAGIESWWLIDAPSPEGR